MTAATPQTDRPHPLVQRYIERRQPEMPAPHRQALLEYTQLLSSHHPHTLRELEATAGQDGDALGPHVDPDSVPVDGQQPPRLLSGRDQGVFLAWQTLSPTWSQQQRSAVARWAVACLTTSAARAVDARHDPGRQRQENRDPAQPPGCAMRHPSGLANAAQLHQLRLALQKHLRRSEKHLFQRKLVALGQLVHAAHRHPAPPPRPGCPQDNTGELRQQAHPARALLVANGHILMARLHQADPGLAEELDQQANPWRTATARYHPAPWDQDTAPARSTLLQAWQQAQADPGWTGLDASAQELSLHLTHHLDRWIHRLQHDLDLELHPLTPHRVHQPAFWDSLMRTAAGQAARHCRQAQEALTQALRDQDEQGFHAALDAMQRCRQALEDTLAGQQDPDLQDQDLVLKHQFLQQLRDLMLDHALYDCLVAASGNRDHPQAPTLYAQSLWEPWFNQALAEFTHNMQPQEQHDLVKRLLHTAAPELENIPDPQDILQAPSQPT